MGIGLYHLEEIKALSATQVFRNIRHRLQPSGPQRTNLIVVLVMLTYFILAGAAAVVCIQTQYENGGTFVSLYSHLYRYPVFFGWITIPLLAYTIKYLKSAPTVRLNNRKIFTILTIGAVLFVIVDLQSNNIAPFEIKAEIIQNDDQLKYHFTKEPPEPDEKLAYQNKMLELLKNRSNWSIARYLHYIAIFVQVLNLLCIGFVAIALIVDRTSKKFKDSSAFKIALTSCVLAALVSYLWGLMRAAFVYQKPIYFPEISNPITEVAIAVAFLSITLVIVTGLIFWVGDRLGYLGQFVAIFGLFAGGLSVLFVTSFQNSLVLVFGKDAGTLPYWTILLAMGIVAMFMFLGYRIRA